MKDPYQNLPVLHLSKVLVRNLLHLLKKTACQNTVINTKSDLSLSVLKKGMLTNNYIPQDKISFTIIAFPVPDIGRKFEKNL